MSLINLKDLLNNAKENKYAVGGFALANLDFIDSIIEVAIEENSPIILQLAEVHFRYLGLEEVAPAIIDAAKNVNIPICVHLDHGESFSAIIRAIRAGFTSVMFDGSKYKLDENIIRTKEIVKIAHAVGVSVEAELGNVGGETIGEEAPIAHSADKKLFTNVEDAARFCRETNVDALAIAIGNIHGLYKGKPELDFERLSKIRKIVDVPLVLHGGSGIPDKDFKKAISLGICKVNYYTEMSNAVVKGIREYLSQNLGVSSYPDIVNKGMEALKRVVRDRIKVFGSRNICASEKTLCISCSEKECGLVDPKLKSGAKTLVYGDLVEKISNGVISQLKRNKNNVVN